MTFPWRTTPSHLVLGIVGDVMLGRLVDKHLAHVSSAYPWGNLLPFLQSTDVNVANLENVFSRCEEKVLKVFNFKADPHHVKSLQAGSIHVVSLANNHSLDFTQKGLLDTIFVLDQHGITHVGAGKDIDQAKQAAKLEARGYTIGVLGCTDNEPSWLATENQPGTFYLRVGDLKAIEGEISRLRQEVDILILSIHWGPNMRERPPKSFIDFAHRLIDCGADIIHGHSAHIFQGIEVYKNRLILYDCGDFIDDYAVDPHLRNDTTFLFILEVMKREEWKLYLIPALISEFQVNRAEGEDLITITKRMMKLSSEFQTSLVYEETPLPHLSLHIPSESVVKEPSL